MGGTPHWVLRLRLFGLAVVGVLTLFSLLDVAAPVALLAALHGQLASAIGPEGARQFRAVFHVWSCGWLTAVSSGLGVLPLLCLRMRGGSLSLSPQVLASSNAVAAGMMISASILLVFEGVDHADAGAAWGSDLPNAATPSASTPALRVVAGVVTGIAFILWSKRWLGAHNDVSVEALASSMVGVTSEATSASELVTRGDRVSIPDARVSCSGPTTADASIARALPPHTVYAEARVVATSEARDGPDSRRRSSRAPARRRSVSRGMGSTRGRVLRSSGGRDRAAQSVPSMPTQTTLTISSDRAAAAAAADTIASVVRSSDWALSRASGGHAQSGDTAFAATPAGIDPTAVVHTIKDAHAFGARAWLIIAVMTLHSLAEGVGLGVSFGSDGEHNVDADVGAVEAPPPPSHFGAFIALALAVHNIPEGLAVSLSPSNNPSLLHRLSVHSSFSPCFVARTTRPVPPRNANVLQIALVLAPRGVSLADTFLWAVGSSLPQPIVGVPAFLFVRAFMPVLPVGLGFAAGAMAYVAVFELLSEAEETIGWVQSVAIAAAAAVVMAVVQALLR